MESLRKALISKPRGWLAVKWPWLARPFLNKARARICVTVMAIVLPISASANNAEFSAAELMQKMSDAVRVLNYQGSFIYQHRDQIEASSISHRFDQGSEQERIVSLTGDGREVIRNGGHTRCYMPAQKTVLISNAATTHSSDYKSPTGLAAQWDVGLLQKWYQLKVHDADRVAGRSCQIIKLIPKDRHRYGYQLCVDSDNAMLLDAGLINRKGETIERMMFTDIQYPEALADALFVQPEPAPGWTIIHLADADQALAPIQKSRLSWQVQSVPPGFALHSRKPMSARNNGHASESEQLVYSDGIASVSIFIESVDRSPEIVGPIRMGAMHGYGRVQSGQQIMVVGDVPAGTVQWFAEELERTSQRPAAQ